MQKHKTVRFLFALAILAPIAVLAMSESASAQYRPPLSPWLSLFNDNRGAVVDPYHNFVVPRQRAIEEFNRQDQELKTQALQQRQLEGQMDKVLNEPRKTTSFSAPQGAGYRQYLHYYKGLPTGGVPQFGKTR